VSGLRPWQRAAAVAVLASVAACAGVLFTAPPGSSVQVLANPRFVPAEGGVSNILAIVTEPAGTPVSDGTIVLFFTDIGRIEPQAKTRDGIARASFVSDSRSGIATVTAISGGAAPAPTTPTTTLAPGTTPPPSTGTTGEGAGSITITVGNANVVALSLRADPPRITVSNSTHVFARVVGANGNPIANVPVQFEVLPDNAPASPPPLTGGLGTEFFDVTGPVFTNNNGEAENVMRTRRETAGVAQVRAFAPGPTGFVFSQPLGIPIL
jgi:hypothetical protein